jgi:DNA-binding response OmpR family regulator
MKILIAEDDLTSRRILEAILGKWGYEVIATNDGLEALKVLHAENSPPLAIVDWMMPGMDGVEFCRQIRQTQTLTPTYIILLTSKRQQEDVVVGLEAGANDYIRKPFDREELRARIRVGERVVELQSALADRVKMLEEAIVKIKTLQGLLPICSYCKKIRNDQDYWQQIETYVADHSQAEFTHGICPDCIEKHVKGQMETLEKMKEGKNGKIP